MGPGKKTRPFFIDFFLILGHIISMSIFPDQSLRGLFIGFFTVLALALLAIFSYSTHGGVITIAGLLLLVVFCLNLEIGLYLTIFALPVINWNIYLKGLIIPGSDLFGLLLLTAFIGRFIFFKLFPSNQIKEKITKIRLPFILPFICFFVVAVISSLLSKEPGDAVWYTVRWILFFYTAFVVIPVNIITDEKILKRSLWSFVLSASIIALMGAYSLFLQDWQHTFVRVQPVQMFNMYPVGENQNLIAEFLVIGVFFAIALKFLSRDIMTRKLLTLTALLLIFISVLTFSRAAWIVLFIQILLYIWYQTRISRKQYIVILFIGFILLAPLGVYMYRIQHEFRIGISSTRNRVALTQIAWENFLEKPVFGHGSGTFISLVEDNIRFRAQYGDPLDSHGIWQKVLAENGALGIITFIVFLGSMFMMFWKRIVQLYKKGKNNVFLPIVLGACGGLFFQFFNTSYYKGKVWLPLGIAVATWYIVNQKQHDEIKTA